MRLIELNLKVSVADWKICYRMGFFWVAKVAAMNVLVSEQLR